MMFALHNGRSHGATSAVGLAVTAMVSIQLAAALSRPLVAEIGAPAVTWVRMATAGALLLLVTRPSLKGRPPKAIAAAMLLGAGLAIYSVAFFAAVGRIPLGLASTIAFLGPLGVAVIGAGHARQMAAGLAVLAGVGIVMLVSPDLLGGEIVLAADPLGLALAAVAALGWAAYILLTRRVGVMFRGTEGLTFSLATAAVLLTPVGIVGMGAMPSLPILLGSAGLALLAPLLTCWLEMNALRQLGAQAFGILMSLEPAIAVLFGLMFLQETPNALQMTGIALVVLASAGAVKLPVMDQKPA